MRTFVAILALLMLAALATPAVAEHDPCANADDVITYAPEQVWFHEGETKVGNLSDRSDQAPAPFDTTAPAASVQSGAGAGALSTTGATESIAADSQNSAHFAGTFEGCLDTLLVEMYAFQPTNRTSTSGSLEERAHTFGGSLTIDGVTFDLPGPLETKTVANPDGQATYRIRFAISDIRNSMDKKKMTVTGPHTIGFTMTAWYVNTDNTVYLWDSTEVPSGMTFNGTADATYAATKLA